MIILVMLCQFWGLSLESREAGRKTSIRQNNAIDLKHVCMLTPELEVVLG